MFKYLAAISLISVSAVHASGADKFLVNGSKTARVGAPVSCTIPENAFAYISGLSALDTYVSSTGPGFSSGYSIYSSLWFGNGAPLNLVGTAAVTSDETVAQACAAQEAGTATPEQIATIEQAIKADQLWWKVKAQYEKYYDGDIITVTGFVSSKYVGFTSYENWLDLFGPKLGHNSVNHSAADLPPRFRAIQKESLFL